MFNLARKIDGTTEKGHQPGRRRDPSRVGQSERVNGAFKEQPDDVNPNDHVKGRAIGSQPARSDPLIVHGGAQGRVLECGSPEKSIADEEKQQHESGQDARSPNNEAKKLVGNTPKGCSQDRSRKTEHAEEEDRTDESADEDVPPQPVDLFDFVHWLTSLSLKDDINI
jgi:hypothetical protein